jgi:hypothetical protein
MSGAMMAALGNWNPAVVSSVGLVLNLDAAVGALPGSAITTSAQFSGSNYLSVAGGAGTAMGTGDFTWECWVYPTSSSDYQCFIDTRTSPLEGGDDTGFFFGTNFNTLAPIYYTTTLQLESTVSMTLNAWNHVALTRNSGTITLWVNGASGGTQSNTTDLTQQRVLIGGDGLGAALNLTGNISNLRMVKGTAVYTAPFTPPTATLLPISGTQLLLPLTALPFTDISTNLFTVTNNGTVATTATAPLLTAPATDLLGTSVTTRNTNSSMSWDTTTGGIFRKTNTNTADFLEFGPNYSATSQAYTVMMVYRSGSTAGRLLNANTASPDWLMGIWGSPANVQNIFFNGGFIGANNTAATGTWQFGWATYNGQPASAVSNSYVATSSQPTTTFGTGSTNGGFNQLRLFGRYATATTITEVGVYDTALVKVWNGVLTLAQIQTQYAAYKTRFGY